VPTTYDEKEGVLHWTHTPTHGAVYYGACAWEGQPCLWKRRQLPHLPTALPWAPLPAVAVSAGRRRADCRCRLPPPAAYFAPYSYEQHQGLVAEMQCHELVTLEMLGESLDGHDLDLLRVGRDTEDKRRIWVLARQHPGESMAGARGPGGGGGAGVGGGGG
jgi:hypothetical protein